MADSVRYGTALHIDEIDQSVQSSSIDCKCNNLFVWDYDCHNDSLYAPAAHVFGHTCKEASHIFIIFKSFAIKMAVDSNTIVLLKHFLKPRSKIIPH